MDFYNQYSPDLDLADQVHNLLTTLHETIGHASGGSLLSEKERKTGFGRYTNGLEEMRAEILAAYTAITFYDEISASGILGDWPQKVPKQEMIKLFILDRLESGWQRWKTCSEESSEITQAHAIADTGIMYYLIDNSKGAIRLYTDTVVVEDKPVTVFRTEISDLDVAVRLIGELAILVQKMSSEAIATDIEEFMSKYAISTRDVSFSKIVRNMRKIANGGVSVNLQVFPEWLKVKDVTGSTVDVVSYKPTDPIMSCLKMYQSFL
jgi:hypothetical protein